MSTITEQREAPNARRADTGSVDEIIRALYDAISFQPNTQPDFNRLRSLFHTAGRLIPPKEGEDSPVVVLGVEEFIKNSRAYIITTGLESKGFHEREVRRFEESFGDIVHVFSVYESRYSPDDPQPMQRGINSIQLVRQQGRWWVLTILWDAEKPDLPIPDRYR